MKTISKIWLWFLQFINQYLADKGLGDDAEQVTNPAPNPPIEKPVDKEPEPQPIKKLAQYLVVLEAGHYKQTAGKKGYWFTINNKKVRAEEWLVNRKQVEFIYQMFQEQNKKPDMPLTHVLVADRDWNVEKQKYNYNFDATKYHTSKGREYLGYRKNRLNEIYEANKADYKEIIFISVHHNAYDIYSGMTTREIQMYLNAHGYNLIIDGIKGSNTENAMNDYINNTVDIDTSITGLEFYYHGLGDNKLSKILANKLVTWLNIGEERLRPSPARPDTWLYKSGFYILRKTSFKTKLLLELGYMTNKEDVERMLNPQVQDIRAQSIYLAINDYLYE